MTLDELTEILAKATPPPWEAAPGRIALSNHGWIECSERNRDAIIALMNISGELISVAREARGWKKARELAGTTIGFTPALAQALDTFERKLKGL